MEKKLSNSNLNKRNKNRLVSDWIEWKRNQTPRKERDNQEGIQNLKSKETILKL